MKKIIGSLIFIISLFWGITALASTSDATWAVSQINYAQSVSGAEYVSPSAVASKGFQNVNEYSGALNIQESDLTLPGKNGMDFEVSRTYSSYPENPLIVNPAGGQTRYYAYKYQYSDGGGTKYVYILYASEQQMYEKGYNNFTIYGNMSSGNIFTCRSAHITTPVNSCIAYHYRVLKQENTSYTPMILTRVQNSSCVEVVLDSNNCYKDDDFFKVQKEKDEIGQGWHLRMPYLLAIGSTQEFSYSDRIESDITIGGNHYAYLYKKYKEAMFMDEAGQVIGVQYIHYYLNSDYSGYVAAKPMIDPSFCGRFAIYQTQLHIDGTQIPCEYVITDKTQGITYYFSWDGLLLAKKDRFQNKTIYTRGSDGRITSVTDSCGRVISYNWNTPDGYKLKINYGSKTISYKLEEEEGTDAYIDYDNTYHMIYTNAAGEQEGQTVYSSVKRNLTYKEEHYASASDDIYLISDVKYPTGGQSLYTYTKHDEWGNYDSYIYKVDSACDKVGDTIESNKTYEYQCAATANEINNIDIHNFTNSYFTRVTSQIAGGDGNKHVSIIYNPGGLALKRGEYDLKPDGNISTTSLMTVTTNAYVNTRLGFRYMSVGKSNVRKFICGSNSNDTETTIANVYDTRYGELIWQVTAKQIYFLAGIPDTYTQDIDFDTILGLRAYNVYSYTDGSYEQPRVMTIKDETIKQGSDPNYPLVNRVYEYNYTGHTSTNTNMTYVVPSSITVYEREKSVHASIKDGTNLLVLYNYS